MFAYCLNNPVLLYDPSGAVARISKDMSFTNDGLWGQSGYIPGLVREPVFDLSGYICDAASAVADFVGNTSESTTHQNLKDHGFSFYNGTLVLMTELPFDRSAFSFCVIVFDDYYKDSAPSTFSNTLNHEYGHIVHLSMIGPIDYFATTAIPSLIGAGIANYNTNVHKNYFNLPPERITDYLGGVNRGYAPYTNTLSSLFWMCTVVASLVTPY